MTSTPENVTFAGLFQTGRPCIPNFQRGYSWNKNHLEDLWLDIQQIPDGRQHYCGSILVVKKDDIRTEHSSRILQNLILIDGQQRCTTIFILLLAIRNHSKKLENGGGLLSEIENDFIYYRDRDGNEKLRLHNEHDELNTFMKQVVKDQDPNPDVSPKKRIVEALRFFEMKISEMNLGELEELLHITTTKLLSTEVYLDGELDQPTVFEAINNRGLGLSDMDKLKNYCMLLTDRVDDLRNGDINFEIKWFTALQSLMKHDIYEKNKEDKMLGFYWMLFEGKRVTNPFDEFRKMFQPLIREDNISDERKQNLISKFKEYTEGFVGFARAFSEIESRANSYDYWGNTPEENKSRRDAALLHEKQDHMDYSDTFLSVVIASYMKFNHKDYVTILDTVEKTLFRVYRIFNKRSSHGYSKIPLLAHDIYHRKLNAYEADTECRKFAKDEGNLDDMVKELRDMTNAYKWAGIKYFLHEYERDLSGGQCIVFTDFPSDKKQSIEHILPQTPGEDNYWDEAIDKTDENGEVSNESRFTNEDKYELTHRIGNLCLTQDNSFYGNKDYPSKRNGIGEDDRHCYKNATTHQEKELARDYEDWTPENLVERSKKLIVFARKRWLFKDR